MSLSKEYRAISNFFLNTQGISREEIKVILKEVVQDIIKEEINRFTKTKECGDIISKAIKANLYSLRGDISNSILDSLLERYSK